MSTTKTEKTLTFKSERAAKMAFTKAEKVWRAAQGETAGYYGRCMQDPNNRRTTEEIFADLRKLEALRDEALRDEARDHAESIYRAARAQGFWITSWEFAEVNPTRDLISANMD